MFNTSSLRFCMMFVLALLPLLTGCRPTRAITLDESVNGREIELTRDQILTVALPSNPSTGYRWGVAEIDTAIVQQGGEAQFAPAMTDQTRVGTGGTETFRFKAIGAGQTTLKLICHRWWETTVDSLQRFGLTLRVS